MSSIESSVLADIRKEIRSLRSIIENNNPPTHDLINKEKAAELLGVSTKTLDNRKCDGRYQEGIHYKKNCTGDILFFKSRITS